MLRGTLCERPLSTQNYNGVTKKTTQYLNLASNDGQAKGAVHIRFHEAFLAAFFLFLLHLS